MPHQQMRKLTMPQGVLRPHPVRFTPLPEGTHSSDFFSQFTLVWPAFELHINRTMHCVAPLCPASLSGRNPSSF